MSALFLPPAPAFPAPPEILIANRLTPDQIAEAVLASLPGTKRLLVCDAATHEAFGKRILQALPPQEAALLLLEGRPKPDAATLALMAAHPASGLIAVGSGTINDLCKYASFRKNIPYIVFPTAPSMNGYLSMSASLLQGHYKRSLSAHPPKGVYCDLSVLAAAPVRLIRSGLGDALARPTAQADWLLSHLLLGTPYDDTSFLMLAPYEEELCAQSDQLIRRDPGVIALLMQSLLASGWGMTLAGGSMPASQGEHMIAHRMEMRMPEISAQSFHGEQIGVTTLYMKALQERLLASPLRLPPCPPYASLILRDYAPEDQPEALRASQAKYALYEREASLQEKLAQEGSTIRERLLNLTPPPPSAASLRIALAKASVPLTPQSLGWTEAIFRQAARDARYSRDRFTFLDLEFRQI